MEAGHAVEASRRVIPPSLHKHLYLDAMELSRSTDWNHRRIAAELQRRHGTRVPDITVYFWITERSNPIGRWNVFELKPSRELAYVLGVMKGDGFRTSYRRQGKEEIRLGVRDADFAAHFNEAVARVLERERPNKIRHEPRKDEDGAVYFRVRYSSIQLAEFLDRDLSSTRRLAEAHPADYLQGFFDSDGSSTPNLNRGRLYLRVLGSNTNLETLNYVKKLLLERFSIASSISIDKETGYSSLVYHKMVTKRKTLYRLSVSRQDSVRAFAESIGFSIKRKQCVLDDGLRLVEAYGSKEATRHWRELYEKVGRRWRRREPVPHDPGSSVPLNAGKDLG